MSLRNDLPAVSDFARPKAYQADPPADVLARWPASAAASDNDTEIAIYDQIGVDWWSGEGWTAKKMRAILNRVKGKDITVKINSPGGDVFEGLAIYNELRAHNGKVTVQVMGLAASAASFIAMAGDEIVMGLGTFMMVHKAWGMVVGNEDDFREAADLFAQFDAALSDIYEARTGKSADEIGALMREETWMGPKEAIALGFADSSDDGLKLEAPADTKDNKALMARRATEAALAKAGHSRNSRAALMGDLGSAPRDASREAAPRDAGFDTEALLAFNEKAKGFLQQIRSKG